MFVGHAFLAFGITAIVARRYGTERRHLRVPGGVTVTAAVAAGLAAGAFASLPDLDVIHAAFQTVTLPAGSTAFDHFWAATGDRHRTTTHSLVVALLASGGFALSIRRPWAGGGCLAGVVALGLLTGGLVGAAIMGLFVAGGLFVTAVAVRTGLGPRSVLGASILGLALHPFTDLLTGEPPAVFAPWNVSLVGGRVEPFADPTVNLLLAFGTELAVIWFGLLVGLRLLGRRPRRDIDPVAALGLLYAPMAFVLEAPTVDHALPFVATILPLGLVGLLSMARSKGSDAATVVLTALGAITMAWTGFGLVYIVG